MTDFRQSRMVLDGTLQFPPCALSFSSRLVRVYSHRGSRVPRARAELHKSTWGPSLEMKHCHFYQILLTKASYKVSQDLRCWERKFTFWWEELQSHTAKNMDTRISVIGSSGALNLPQKLTKEKIWIYHERHWKGCQRTTSKICIRPYVLHQQVLSNIWGTENFYATILVWGTEKVGKTLIHFIKQA